MSDEIKETELIESSEETEVEDIEEDKPKPKKKRGRPKKKVEVEDVVVPEITTFKLKNKTRKPKMIVYKGQTMRLSPYQKVMIYNKEELGELPKGVALIPFK